MPQEDANRDDLRLTSCVDDLDHVGGARRADDGSPDTCGQQAWWRVGPCQFASRSFRGDEFHPSAAGCTGVAERRSPTCPVPLDGLVDDTVGDLMDSYRGGPPPSSPFRGRDPDCRPRAPARSWPKVPSRPACPEWPRSREAKSASTRPSECPVRARRDRRARAWGTRSGPGARGRRPPLPPAPPAHRRPRQGVAEPATSCAPRYRNSGWNAVEHPLNPGGIAPHEVVSSPEPLWASHQPSGPPRAARRSFPQASLESSATSST
jgi:hypothetical protein